MHVVFRLHGQKIAYSWTYFGRKITPAIVFTARRYASAVLTVIVCLSVCHKSELYKDG